MEKSINKTDLKGFKNSDENLGASMVPGMFNQAPMIRNKKSMETVPRYNSLRTSLER